MVAPLKNDFARIYSVEISEELHAYAARRFRGRDHIHLILRDSGIVMRDILANLDQPALLWLDGQCSRSVAAKGEKETPTLEELRHIFQAPDRCHVILIDDARCFGADLAYQTMAELAAFVRLRRPHASVSVDSESIRITTYG
jgi:hypothetical protein